MDSLFFSGRTKVVTSIIDNSFTVWRSVAPSNSCINSIMSLNSRTMQKAFTPYWLPISILVFLIHLITGLLLAMMLNGNLVNHVLTPIFQYIGIFKLIWPEQPFGALQFIATKSLLAFAYQDSRSGLNLWTLEYDSITLAIFAIISLALGWVFARVYALKPHYKSAYVIISIIGALFVAFSVSYMTNIEHCSGATWAGFVALYGVGFNEFELFPIYQWISATIGITLLGWGVFAIKRAPI